VHANKATSLFLEEPAGAMKREGCLGIYPHARADRIYTKFQMEDNRKRGYLREAFPFWNVVNFTFYFSSLSFTFAF